MSDIEEEPDVVDRPDTERIVMASIDSQGSIETFIVSDITRDGAWMSIPKRNAMIVSNWR
jgi:hypothetical protein